MRKIKNSWAKYCPEYSKNTTTEQAERKQKEGNNKDKGSN